MHGSQSFSVGRRTFDQPNVRYWEDIECPVCEKKTEHRRTNRWDLVCTECGQHFVPDPLKRFQSKEEKAKTMKRYILPKLLIKYDTLVAELKQWIINFESLDKENFLDSVGKKLIITFTDFNEKKTTSDFNLSYLTLAKKNQIALFHTKLCDMGQTDASVWWKQYLEIKDWLDRYPDNEKNE